MSERVGKVVSGSRVVMGCIHVATNEVGDAFQVGVADHGARCQAEPMSKEAFVYVYVGKFLRQFWGVGYVRVVFICGAPSV